MTQTEKLHTLTITEHNPETRFFRYQFSCPGYTDDEYAPCAVGTPCRKCNHDIEDDIESFIEHGEEHILIDGEWSVRLKNVCAVANYPDVANDCDVDEIAQVYGNGTYLVDIEPAPYLQPATFDIVFKDRSQ